MNSILKVALPLILLVGVVGLVTILSDNDPTPKPPPPSNDRRGSGSGPDPIDFATKHMVYDPNSSLIVNRHFPMYYEVSETQNHASFWFRNAKKEPVTITPTYRSCSVCTMGRLAIVPQESRKQMLSDFFLAGVSRSPMAGPDLLSLFASVRLQQSLRWEELHFPEKQGAPGVNSAMVPPAESDGTPTLGVLQLLFKTTFVGEKPINVRMKMQLPGSVGVEPQFDIMSIGKEQFEPAVPGMVFSKEAPRVIEFGDFPEGEKDRISELYCISWTRSAEDTVDFPALAKPNASLNLEDKFVQMSPPVKMTVDELKDLSRRLTAQFPARIRSGYRMNVTLRRKIDPKERAKPEEAIEPDIGPLERKIALSVPGMQKAYQVEVTAKVIGLVKPRDDDKIDLGNFNGVRGVTRTVTLESQHSDLELTPVPGGHNPNYLTAEITDTKVVGTRKYWTLTVSTGTAKILESLPVDSCILFKAKLPNEPERNVRIVVTGTGTQR